MRNRLLKSLRIAVTAVSLLACGVLIVLWVRSYDHFDWCGPGIKGTRVWHDFHAKSGFLMESARGTLTVLYVGDLHEHKWWKWSAGSNSTREWLRATEDGGESASDGFRAKFNSDGSFSGSAPHWCVAIFAAAIAALPWIKWRFSLHTLLIVLTLFAVFFGVIAMSL